MSALSNAERKRVQEYLATAGDRVLNVAHALNTAQLTFRPRHDKWSIAENIEHLTIVDRLVLGQVAAVAAIKGPLKESAWKGKDEALLQLVRRREPAIKAPEIISPSGSLDPGRIVDQFESCRRDLSEFIMRTETPLRDYCFSHPVFGELDCYQWLLCSGAHYERHLLQIQEVLEAPVFPSA